MLREVTCIICPNGCRIRAELLGQEVKEIEGALCLKGQDYVRQELTDPRRTVATSIWIGGGVLPLTSVRLTAPIPKARLFDAMKEIKKQKLTAPVEAGTVVIKKLLGYDCDVIVTKSVDRIKS